MASSLLRSYSAWVGDNPRLATDLEKAARGIALLANGEFKIPAFQVFFSKVSNCLVRFEFECGIFGEKNSRGKLFVSIHLELLYLAELLCQTVCSDSNSYTGI